MCERLCATKLCVTKLCVTKSYLREMDSLASVDVPGKGNVDVTKCHPCHANGMSMSPSATPATQSAVAPRATNGAQAHHQSQPSVISATPATPNESWCKQVPRLPR